jgi:hypothetical protein
LFSPLAHYLSSLVLGLVGILEIALTAYTEKKKGLTETGYAVSVQRQGYSVEVRYAGRILNFKGEFPYLEPTPACWLSASLHQSAAYGFADRHA